MMRLLSILFVLSLLLNLSTGCSNSNQNIQNVSDEESGQESTEIRIYEIFGMDCPGCHGGIEQLAKKIPGVQNASANWKKKELRITVDPGSKLNDEDVYSAIKRANFTQGKRLQ